MFTGKVIATLFLIATAGALDAGRGLVGGDAGAMAAPSPVAPAVATAMVPASPNSASMGQVRAAVARALQARVRDDLDDDSVAVDVSGLSLRRDGANLVSVDGRAMVSLGAGGVLPVRVEADWNAGARRIDRLDYAVTGAATAQPPLRAANSAPRASRIGAMLHAAIEDKVGAGIGREFVAQHPRFQLVAVDSIAVNSRWHTMQIPGNRDRREGRGDNLKERDMSDIRKDHSIGAGTGAAAGAVTGATVGAVGGPIGMAAGAIVGGIVGAAAGDSIAEAVNPTEYNTHWKNTYQSTPYYASGKEWNDYEPAYKLGYDAYGSHRGRKFEDVETDLERNWDSTRGNSKLAWGDAKGAVRDGWHYVERALPGDADGDGR